jgi:hypothetical protein
MVYVVVMVVSFSLATVTFRGVRCLHQYHPLPYRYLGRTCYYIVDLKFE